MKLVYVLLLLILPVAAAAEEVSRDEEKRLLSESPYIRGLRSDGPNFFGVSGTMGSNPLGEIPHAEFNVSIRYAIVDESLEKAKKFKYWKWLPNRVYAIYRGGFDFQALTGENFYDSAPLISTEQNPGMALEWDGQDSTQKFRLGLFHYSNGQTLKDAATVNGYIHNPEVEPAFWLQKVSRSWNYVSFRFQNMNNEFEIIGPGWEQFQFELRPRYFGKDEAIFWGSPPPLDQPEIEDYDGMRLMWEKVSKENSSGLAFINRLEFKTGIKELSNISTRYSFGFIWNSFVMTAYVASEYGHDLSTYHLRTHQWGIGLELR